MARAMWQGSISFGLVEIPVGVYPGETSEELSFRMLDKRDFSPVGYKRINKNTGDEVPWDEIVKGYEYEKDEYVVLTDAELRTANVRATQTIDIVGFVDADEVDPMYYDKPYYVAPLKKGSKSYALLRETLKRTKKMGIARVVLRTRQHLALLMVRGPVLVLELLRFHYELRKPEDLDLPVDELQKLKVTDAEVRLAERLVGEMDAEWNPEEYRDEYRDDVMALIESKIKAGKQRTIVEPKEGREVTRGEKVVDLVALLKKSVAEAEKPKRKGPKAATTPPRRRRKAAG